MKTLILVDRIVMGLIFFVFGLNGFFHFLPEPEPTRVAAQEFLGGLAASGYLLPLLKGTETVCGLALLAGRFVPLALTVLAPIVLNIFLFHTLVEPGGQGLVIAVVVLALEIFLAWAYRGHFKSVLTSGAKPTT